MLYEPSPPDQNQTVASLEDYLEALRRRRVLVALCTLALLGLTFAYTNQRELYYEARARILVNPTPSGNNGGLPAPNLEREVSILLGDAISATARASAATTDPAAASEGSVTAGYLPQSDVLTLTATSLSADRAASLASAYATAYVEERVTDQIAYFDASIGSIDVELETLVPKITEGENQIEYWDAQAAGWSNLPTSTEKATALAQIQNERTKVSTELQSTTARKNGLDNQRADLVRAKSVQAPAATVISAAKPPDGPTGVPNWGFLVVGGVLGFLVGTIFAFLLERLDRSAQSTSDVELAIGRPVLGSLPRFSWRFRRGKWALIMANDRPIRALQSTREAFRRLRSSVQFLARADGAQIIVVTSSKALEGKSTTAANLAVTLALAGDKVALISGDMRRPSIERLFQIDNRTGLSDFLSGKVETLHVERFVGFESLAVIPAGPVPTNPGELFNSARFAQLITRLKQEFDIVVIDTPPLAAAADALAASVRADGVIIVVDGKRTETTDLLAIRNDLDRSGVRLFGAVLNRDRSQRSGLLRRNKYSYYGGGRRGADGSGAIAIHTSRRLQDSLSLESSEVPPGNVTTGDNGAGPTVLDVVPIEHDEANVPSIPMHRLTRSGSTVAEDDLEDPIVADGSLGSDVTTAHENPSDDLLTADPPETVEDRDEQLHSSAIIDVDRASRPTSSARRRRL